VLSSFLVALTTISSAYGQINVYENLIDPTAICRIDDVNPLRYEIRQGIKQERDSEGFMTVSLHISGLQLIKMIHFPKIPFGIYILTVS
jgi:hypothetical protein